MLSRIEKLCIERGMKMTGQRRVIARVLSESDDHPDVEELFRRSAEVDANISIATVYRTVRMFKDAGLLDRLDFGDGRARYEETTDLHHDHLIDVRSGKVIEFQDDSIEQAQKKIAEKLGFKLMGHRLQLFCVPIDQSED